MSYSNIPQHNKKTPKGYVTQVAAHPRKNNRQKQQLKVDSPGSRKNLVELSDQDMQDSAVVLIQETRQMLHKQSPQDVVTSLKNAIDNFLDEEIVLDYSSDQEVNTSEYDGISDDEALSWAHNGFHPEGNWKTWKTFGFEPEEAHGWEAQEVSIGEALRWKNIGPEDYLEWKETRKASMDCFAWKIRNFTPEEMVKCLDANIFVAEASNMKRFGPIVEVAEVAARHNLDLKTLERWRERNIAFDQADKWLQKGYTPAKAQKLVEAGKKPEDVKDLRNNAPLPGTSWAKINKHATANGWTMKEPKKQERYGYYGGEAPKVYCELTKKGQTLYAHFTSSGRFLKLSHSPRSWLGGERKLKDSLGLLQ